MLLPVSILRASLPVLQCELSPYSYHSCRDFSLESLFSLCMNPFLYSPSFPLIARCILILNTLPSSQQPAMSSSSGDVARLVLSPVSAPGRSPLVRDVFLRYIMKVFLVSFAFNFQFPRVLLYGNAYLASGFERPVESPLIAAIVQTIHNYLPYKECKFSIHSTLSMNCSYSS